MRLTHSLTFTYLTYCFLAVAWGSNFIFMKWAGTLISPSQIVLYRLVFGFTPILLIALWQGALRWRDLRNAHHFFVMSLLATAIYYFGFAKATTLMASGSAGAVSGAVPIFAFIMAVMFIREEKVTALKLLGVSVGFIGVVMIAKPFDAFLSAESIETGSIEGVTYMVLGSLSLGASFVYAKHFIAPLKLGVFALTSYQLGFATLLTALLTDFSGAGALWADKKAAIGMVLGLGLLGTGMAFLSYYLIVERLGAVKAASVTYFPPLVAMAIGAIIANEPLQWLDYLGGLTILVGVYILNYTPREQTRLDN